MRIFFALLFVIVIQPAMGQEYRFRSYRVEQGLPSDVVKAVAQDSLGFIWIATDDGLVKYDGLHFETYSTALQSQYAKGFLQTRNGRLLAFSDLDLVEIENRLDTVIFHPLLRGARLLADSTIWFPKSVYEDRHGNIWLAEPQSAVRFNKDGIKRFAFDVQHRSPVFIRSFTFFEDENGTLYTTSYGGRIFRFDERRDDFILLDDKLPANCSFAQMHNGQLLIAAGTGLYEADFDGSSVNNVRVVISGKHISHFTVAADTALWVTTFSDESYRLKNVDGGYQSDLLDFKFNGSNSVYTSKEGDVWVSTDKGLVLIQENLFELADPFSTAQFIEAITEDSLGNIYFANKDILVKLPPGPSGNRKRVEIYGDTDGYFQSLHAGPQGLWASNGTAVYLFKDSKLARHWEFGSEGNFVHDIFMDSKKQLWAAQAGNANVMLITESDVKRYPIPTNKLSEVNLVREGPEGMYVAASGIDRYLFIKKNGSDRFEDISLPLDFKVKGDFNIYDIDVQGKNVWIASTEGLLMFDHQTIQRVDLGETFTKLSVSSVEVFDDENILFSNSHGLFRYNTTSKEYWFYDENSGLPSNTITGRGIFVDHEGTTWIGTAFGIANNRAPITGSEKTSRPYCVGVQANGHRVMFSEGVVVPYGSFINLQFSSITFPENRIILQWRVNEDTLWHTMEFHEVSLGDLSAGTIALHVRAKKNTGLGWSEPITVQIITLKPYWQRAEFLFIVLTVVLVISWISYSLTSRIMNKRKAMLERLVDQRTRDLQIANEELLQRNSELDRFVYSASHDLSAPLKSILGLISVSRMEKPGDQHIEYLRMMEASVRKLENFISDVVSYSRNTRQPLKLESFSFGTLVKDILDDHQYSPNFSCLHIDVKDTTGELMVADIMRLRIILNNLVSNAIKFHRPDVQEQPFVRIQLERNPKAYIITVEDNGCGIDEKHTTHIFEMFYRASDIAQGSGLGLYILKETVLKMSGRASVKSTLGVGSMFTIMLPAPEINESIS